MKIGILTLPPYANYGGILQAYALQTVLREMGHEVYVLVNEHKFYKPDCIEYIKRIILKLLGRNVKVWEEKRNQKEAHVILGNLWQFIDDHINKYKISAFEELRAEGLDTIIVGSDQIWRPQYFIKLWRASMQNAYLSFSDGWNIRRIAYAASLGVDDWEYTSEQTQQCSKYAKSFDAISVREKSAVSLLKKHFGVNPEFVLDPTMLLPIEKYENLFKAKPLQTHKRGLLNYILDNTEKKSSIINRFAAAKNLIAFSVTNTMVEDSAPIEDRIMPSVEAWLKGFYDAEFIVTDSFHACVFSILFHKPFVAIGNSGRGLGRFKSLLETFGLENHLLSVNDEIDYLSDYSIPNIAYEKLEMLKQKSLDFLHGSLTNTHQEQYDENIDNNSSI